MLLVGLLAGFRTGYATYSCSLPYKTASPLAYHWHWHHTAPPLESQNQNEELKTPTVRVNLRLVPVL